MLSNKDVNKMKKVVALVTGGNRGIGASCVEVLAKMGASVVINYWRISNFVIKRERYY